MAQSPSRSDPPNGSAHGAGPFRINAAAELSGVPAATLRAWERRYGVPVPRRTASAYRLYTAEDVQLVQRMRALVEEGVSPAEAARVVLSTAPDVADVEPSATDGLELARSRLLAATQRWDVAAIDAELARVSMLVDGLSFYERVVSPVLVELGQRWERGDVSVAQEHMLADRIELAVRASLRALERTEGPLALLACVDAEQHVIGLLGAALRFSLNGARTVVLGAMTPADAVADAVRNMAPAVVGLSLAMAPSSPRPFFRAYGKACGGTPWVVGGAAAPAFASAIEAAGGVVAHGPSSEWSSQVRDWLRGAR